MVKETNVWYGTHGMFWKIYLKLWFLLKNSDLHKSSMFLIAVFKLLAEFYLNYKFVSFSLSYTKGKQFWRLGIGQFYPWVMSITQLFEKHTIEVVEGIWSWSFVHKWVYYCHSMIQDKWHVSDGTLVGDYKESYQFLCSEILYISIYTCYIYLNELTLFMDIIL